LYNSVVQKLQFLNNFRLKPAKCQAFCKTCETANRAVEQVQLYYKYLLIKTNGNSSNNSNINKIFKKCNANPRVLGSNKIVLKTFDEIKDADNYYYIAIVPTATSEMNSNRFRNKIDGIKAKDSGFMPSENVYLCYWGNIEKYFKGIDAEKVLEVFKYNEGQIY
jgi:hypothetical protein